MFSVRKNLPITLMLFLQYTLWGAWYVTLGTYLGQTLQFTGTQIGLVYGTFALSAIFSPLISGVLADHLYAPRKVLASLHLLGVIFLFFIVQSETFTDVYLLIFLYALCYMPTIALTNSIAMANLDDPESDFPKVRVMGTLGWILVGWVVSFLEIEASYYPIFIALGLSLLMVLNCWWLPKEVNTSAKSSVSFKTLIGLDALMLLKERAFLTLMLASLLISIPLSFYFGFTNLFLNDIGVSYPAAKMTFGQVSEILFMLLLPVALRKFGIKWIVLAAMLAWALRYLSFSLGADNNFALLMLGILLHGICYDFFFVAGQIYVNQSAPSRLRNSAQGLLTQFTYGIGMFLGTWLSGLTVTYFTSENQYHWQPIWLVPAALSLAVAVGFYFIFPSIKNK
ncbi:MFS transporter [Alteromonadaceae bacterium M269]|nr:MFS transporter [Alteromonadaceae bacterium M269]